MSGYQYVSLRPIPVTPNEPKYPLGSDADLLARTRRKMRDTGIRLLDIELARIYDGVSIPDYEPALAAAAELGGRFVLSSGWTPNHPYTVEKFGELCDLAGRYGLTVCFEFVTFASVSDLAGAAAVVREASRKNAGLCIDTLHFYRSGCHVEELDSLPASWFPYLQICDAASAIAASREEMIFTARADRKFPGEGVLPIADILNRLPPVPYAIEAPNAALNLWLSPVEFARRARASAESYLDAHPRPAVTTAPLQASGAL